VAVRVHEAGQGEVCVHERLRLHEWRRVPSRPLWPSFRTR
jgi:hypothetical protein